VPRRTPTPPWCGRELGKPDLQPARNGPRCATSPTASPLQIRRPAPAHHRAPMVGPAQSILRGRLAAGTAERVGGPR
jgi:hypothetical protein